MRKYTYLPAFLALLTVANAFEHYIDGVEIQETWVQGAIVGWTHPDTPWLPLIVAERLKLPTPAIIHFNGQTRERIP